MEHQGTTIERNVVIRDGEAHEAVKKHQESYEPSDREVAMARLERFQTIANWFIGAVVITLGARFLLNLLAANPAAGFSQLVNALTTPLVLPFTALFAMPTAGASVFDSAALTAMLVYSGVGYGVISLIKAIMAPSDPTGRAYR